MDIHSLGNCLAQSECVFFPVTVPSKMLLLWSTKCLPKLKPSHKVLELPHRQFIITHLPETLKFTVSNSSLYWWKDMNIAINIPLNSKALYRHTL